MSSPAFDPLLQPPQRNRSRSSDHGSGNNAAGSRTHLVFFEGQVAPRDLAERAQALLNEGGVDAPPSSLYDQLGGFAVPLTDQQAQQLRQLKGVASVEADRPVSLIRPVPTPAPVAPTEPGAAEGDPGDAAPLRPLLLTAYANGTAGSGEVLPWGVKAVWGGLDISTKGNVGAGSYAFVIDTGVLDTTGDLTVNTAWSRSWIAGETPFTDGNGHGTHVAGTIGALANGIGVVGVAPGASIVSLKVFDSTGAGGLTTSIIDAINYAVGVINTNGLDKSKVVINMSLGGGNNPSLVNAVVNAANQGIRFAIAAGNGDAQGVGQDVDTVSPANAGDHPNVYTVSAVDSTYKMTSWSNWDRIDSTDSVDDVDVAAPGLSVYSYYRNGTLAYLSGTSMASPHVAGLLLMGGVKAGDLVTPYYAGTADPFALAAQTFSPTYGLSAPASINEDSALAISITSSNVAAGTVVYWSFSGTGISGADFNPANLSGSVTIAADGTATISTSVLADAITEGAETLQVSLFSDAALTTSLASASLVINDTSQAAAPAPAPTPTPTPTPTPAPPTNLVLWGTTGSDAIVAGDGNDRLTGVLATGTTTTALGKGQVDKLTGGLGADVFVLGDSRGVFYDDGVAANVGSSDYAWIRDFQAGIDHLQLRAGFSYIASYAANGSTSLYWDRNANGILNITGNNRDELISIIDNARIASTDIVWG